jgi:hypothetical protein
MAYSVPTFREKSKADDPRVKSRCSEVLWAKMDWNFCLNGGGAGSILRGA